MKDQVAPCRYRRIETSVAGRPGRRRALNGSRNRLGEQVLEALAQNFAENGPAAIIAYREEKPTECRKVVASLLLRSCWCEDPVDELGEQEIADELGIPRGIVARTGERAP